MLIEANKLDDQIIIDDPTHLLFLQYCTTKGMGFHKDNGKNDGAGVNPVVSISLGNSCIFSIKHTGSSSPIDIELKSGDVIIFGGESRFMMHAVTKVMTDCPDYLLPIIGNVRLNYTMRYAPEILGRESEFETFDAMAATKYGKKHLSK